MKLDISQRAAVHRPWKLAGKRQRNILKAALRIHFHMPGKELFLLGPLLKLCSELCTSGFIGDFRI